MLCEYDNKIVGNLVKILNNLNFERVDHDLRYDEFQKIIDIFYALKYEAPKTLEITNKTLIIAV